MSKIDELIERLCPDGIPFRTIDSLVQVVPAPKKIHRSDYLEQGAYPVIDQGASLIAAKTNDSSALVDVGACVLFGDHTRTIKFYTKPFAQGADGLKILVPKKSIMPRYLFHAMKAASIPNRGYSRHWSMAKAVHIPIPPMEIQTEIVRILDSFSELEAELEAELGARQEQYSHYRDMLLSNNGDSSIQQVALADIGTVRRGKRFVISDYVEKGLEAIHYGEIYTTYSLCATEAVSHLPESMAPSLRFAHKGDVIIAATGENVEDLCKPLVWCGEKDVAVHDDCFILTSDLEPRYIAHCLLSSSVDEQKRKYVSSGKVSRITEAGLYKITIPLPPVETQRRIVSILDKFDALVNDLSSGIPAEIEARRKQYEYYRDKLLTFKEKPSD